MRRARLRGRLVALTVSAVCLGVQALRAADYLVWPGALPGLNVLAVEVHPAGPTSTDLSFDLELLGLRAPLDRSQCPFHGVRWTERRPATRAAARPTPAAAEAYKRYHPSRCRGGCFAGGAWGPPQRRP